MTDNSVMTWPKCINTDRQFINLLKWKTLLSKIFDKSQLFSEYVTQRPPFSLFVKFHLIQVFRNLTHFYLTEFHLTQFLYDYKVLKLVLEYKVSY